jgi:uncharacterized protein (DUF1499 family)
MTSPPDSPRLRKLRIAILLTAVLAVLALVAAGPGTRVEIWPWRVGLLLVAIAMGLGLLVIVASLVMVAVPPWRRGGPALLLAALVLGTLAALPPLVLLAKAKRVPAIHDITTDFNDPPAFVALAQVRKDAPNGIAYGGPEIASQQRGYYPDVYPVVVKRPPAEAFQKALDAARASGWQVVASDAAAGRIEATDTTAWFGFKDDIVVRVRPVEGGSRIDARSMSRVGRSDLGANAERLGKFLAKLS